MAAVWRQGPRNHAALAEAGRRAMGAAAAPAAAAAAADEGWEEHYDDEVGSRYWYNRSSGESSWVRPSALGVPSQIG